MTLISSNSRRRDDALALVAAVNGDYGDYLDFSPERLALVETNFTPKESTHISITSKFCTLIRSLITHIPSCPKWLGLGFLQPSPAPTPPPLLPPLKLGHRVTGTLFGHRRGHVRFAVQEHPRARPVVVLELATPTSALVREMASGLVRIALECERSHGRGKLLLEQVWTMYCNGRKAGYAFRRVCSEEDWQVLELVQAVSMGVGVLPPSCMSHQDSNNNKIQSHSNDNKQLHGSNNKIQSHNSDKQLHGSHHVESEFMYMRAKFERVVGSKDSEAFYMINPDRGGGPELSIFLLRI